MATEDSVKQYLARSSRLPMIMEPQSMKRCHQGGPAAVSVYKTDQEYVAWRLINAGPKAIRIVPGWWKEK